jgi:hypothetical protein
VRRGMYSPPALLLPAPHLTFPSPLLLAPPCPASAASTHENGGPHLQILRCIRLPSPSTHRRPPWFRHGPALLWVRLRSVPPRTRHEAVVTARGEGTACARRHEEAAAAAAQHEAAAARRGDSARRRPPGAGTSHEAAAAALPQRGRRGERRREADGADC